jgi:hypothetical protein
MKINRIISYLAIATAIIVVGCDEDQTGPKLPDQSEFGAPDLLNDATAPVTVFEPEDANETYEVFRWERTNYGGVRLSTNYVIEIDNNADFSSPANVATTSADSLVVTVDDFNDAMLGLGLAPFVQSTVNLRIRSTVNNLPGSTPIYSDTIVRIVKTYQLSECGDFCTIGLIGSATTGDNSGWNNDIDMRLADPTRVDKHNWTVIAYLYGGFAAKFRAQDGWDVNWGSNGFPNGTGTQNGADIPVSTSGYYRINLNDETGDYTFTLLTTPVYATIGLIGSATTADEGAGETGWNQDIDLTQDAGDPHVWTGTFTLYAGAVKFRADNGWTNNWGSNTFRSGHGVGGGADIPSQPGSYFVRFNDATGEYSFMATNRSTPYTDVGIIGFATTGTNAGWDNDINMIRHPQNPYLWSTVITLFDGPGKFRADNGWTVNWGASTVPAGVGIQDGPDIPITEGTYHVTFNSGTGEYYFLK